VDRGGLISNKTSSAEMTPVRLSGRPHKKQRGGAISGCVVVVKPPFLLGKVFVCGHIRVCSVFFLKACVPAFQNERGPINENTPKNTQHKTAFFLSFKRAIPFLRGCRVRPSIFCSSFFLPKPLFFHWIRWKFRRGRFEIFQRKCRASRV